MDKNTRTNDTQTNGSGPGAAAGEAPAAAPQHANGDLLASGSLTNAEVTALSRERLQTLLSILPPAVAAILITNRPPMPPHVEYDAHRKLVAALAQARAKIPSVPMDKTVDYISKRTGDHVHYTFASLDSIHKTITGPLSEHGLVQDDEQPPAREGNGGQPRPATSSRSTSTTACERSSSAPTSRRRCASSSRAIPRDCSTTSRRCTTRSTAASDRARPGHHEQSWPSLRLTAAAHAASRRGCDPRKREVESER